jgi:hypothetical protein
MKKIPRKNKLTKNSGKVIITSKDLSADDKYFGTFKVEKWPENLDEFIVSYSRRINWKS